MSVEIALISAQSLAVLNPDFTGVIQKSDMLMFNDPLLDLIVCQYISVMVLWPKAAGVE